MDRLTIKQVEEFLVQYDSYEGISGNFPEELARQLADTMRENERLREGVKSGVDWMCHMLYAAHESDRENLDNEIQNLQEMLESNKHSIRAS
jgi:hypothetical protein